MSDEEMIEETTEEFIEEDEEKLPFAKAEVVRLMKENLDDDKMIRERVKVEMNKFLGDVLVNVCKQLNDYPYSTVEYEMLKESTYPYTNIERINEEKIKLNTLEVEEKSIVNKLEDLIKLEEEFATIHEHLKEIEQKNYEINLAKDFLEKAYEKMKKNITPKFTFNLSENIKNITNGKYTNINVNDENGLIVEIQNGEYIPAERLSIGTIDQLYLSLRISMIEEISKEKMPIILDEAFAYFDDERLENILKYLTQKYKQHQLIIFTCTNREKNILDKLNCIYNSVEL